MHTSESCYNSHLVPRPPAPPRPRSQAALVQSLPPRPASSPHIRNGDTHTSSDRRFVMKLESPLHFHWIPITLSRSLYPDHSILITLFSSLYLGHSIPTTLSRLLYPNHSILITLSRSLNADSSILITFWTALPAPPGGPHGVSLHALQTGL